MLTHKLTLALTQHPKPINLPLTPKRTNAETPSVVRTLTRVRALLPKIEQTHCAIHVVDQTPQHVGQPRVPPRRHKAVWAVEKV